MVQLRVACIKNIQGEETPCTLFLNGRQVTVLEVLDQWLAFDHRYFKIQGDDNGVYILRHDVAADLWELTFFEQQQTFPEFKSGRNGPGIGKRTGYSD